MCYWDPQLSGRECGGERCVYVASDDNHGWSESAEHRLDGYQRLAGLLAVRPATNIEKRIRPREVEVFHDVLRQPRVVMLAGMDHVLFTAPNRLHGAYDRRHLDEIRPRPHDINEVPHRKRWFDAWASMDSPVGEKRQCFPEPIPTRHVTQAPRECQGLPPDP